VTKRKLIDLAFAAYNTGEFRAAFENWQPDARWDFTHFEGWPGEAVFRGPDEIASALEDWTAGFDEFYGEVEELHEAPDGRVVAFCHQGGRPRHAPTFAELRWAQIWTFRDDLIESVENWSDREAALRAAGLA
jgi:ketosteroid isomerase-like protein